MAKSENQKLKMLYILHYLQENSDDDHPVKTADLIAYLKQRGISAERKSIYSDIQELRHFALPSFMQIGADEEAFYFDIQQADTRNGGGYYLGQRFFELAELKLLVDAVQSSLVVPAGKSRTLIAKLEKLTGKHQAKALDRQVIVSGRVKTENEKIFYSTDAIHHAIQNNLQISFTYLDWDRNLQLIKRGEKRLVSPWHLVYRDDKYYLVAYEAASEKIKHYRVDKMQGVQVLENTPREGAKVISNLHITEYIQSSFGMYAGEEKLVKVEIPEKLLGVFVDRIGKGRLKKPQPVKDAPGRYLLRFPAAVSAQFFGWIFGLGHEVKITGPTEVREAYVDYLKNMLELYEE